jgi:hypothetical protein
VQRETYLASESPNSLINFESTCTAGYSSQGMVAVTADTFIPLVNNRRCAWRDPGTERSAGSGCTTGIFTQRYNCDRLVWFQRRCDLSKAIAREKELKGWRREKKIALIEAANPTWEDLSRDWYDLEPADYRRALDRMNS